MIAAQEYPHVPGYKARGTSKDAAVAETGRASTLRDQVFDLLYALGPTFGRTADECAAMVGSNILSIRPRLSELVKAGKIEDSGTRRRNHSDHKAIVWRVVERRSQQDLNL